MLAVVKRFDEDSNLKWVVDEHQAHFAGKLTFAQELPNSDHDAELTSPYLGIARSSLLDEQLTTPCNPYINSDLFKSWIRDCGDHEACQPDDAIDIDRLRVIDCETRTLEMAPEDCHYVTLSYLWGQPEGITEQSLPAKQLPTIEDAITVTLRLGFRYLWVDRICIDQSSVMDKDVLIKQMGQIYASAHLTIIAAAGLDPTYGLPGVSQPRQETSARAEQIGPVSLVELCTPTANGLLNSTWATRAWTFQEGILSKRRLIFTETATLYICHTDYLHDLNPGYSSGFNYELLALTEFFYCSRLPKQVQSSAGSSRFKEALTYIKAYSRRNLGFHEDALKAIVGILNYISNDKRFPTYHFWGVPLSPLLKGDNRLENIVKKSEGGAWKYTPNEDVFEFALNWIHKDPCQRRNGFPSWSPLGWNGSVDYPLQYVDIIISKDFDVRIRKTKVEDAEDRPFLRHELKRGLIQYERKLKDAISTELEIVNGLVAPVQISRNEDGGFQIILADDTVLTSDLEIYWDANLEMEMPIQSAGNLGHANGAPWLVWQLGYQIFGKGKRHYMVLRLREDGVYERVGLAISWKGRSDAGLRGSSQIDAIRCERINSFLLA